MTIKSCLLFFWIIGVVLAKDFQILLLHNNDIHGRFEETSRNSGTCKAEDKNRNCYGGFARLAKIVREARMDAESGAGPKVLYLNAGDTFTGTAWFTVHKWRIAADMLNRLAPDAISLGNHEFDYGLDGLVPFVDNFRFPIVAANLNFSRAPALRNKIEKSVVLDVEGRKVGIIGYLTQETKEVSLIDEVDFLDEIESLKSESERLDKQGVKIIIAVGHSGIDVDQKIAKHVPLVDVVIGGHTNTFLWNGKPPDVEIPEGPYPIVVSQESGKRVVVVQAYAYTKYMGRLYVTFNDKGDLIDFEGKPLLLSPDISQDKDILDALDYYKKDLDVLMKKVVGRSRVDLDIANCRLKECNFGNFVADSLISNRVINYGGNYWTDAAIAVFNGGSLRMTLDKGELTRGHFLGAMPFDLQIYSFDLNGTHVLEMLENGVRSNGETSRGEFLQVSGLKITYDLNRSKGQRVIDVQVRCAACNVPKYEPLNIEKTYKLITNSYILRGGDSYTVLKHKSFNKRMEDLNDMNTVVSYLERMKIVYPDEGGRISFLDTSKSSSYRNVISLTCIYLIVFTKLVI